MGLHPTLRGSSCETVQLSHSGRSRYEGPCQGVLHDESLMFVANPFNGAHKCMGQGAVTLWHKKSPCAQRLMTLEFDTSPPVITQYMLAVNYRQHLNQYQGFYSRAHGITQALCSVIGNRPTACGVACTLPQNSCAWKHHCTTCYMKLPMYSRATYQDDNNVFRACHAGCTKGCSCKLWDHLLHSVTHSQDNRSSSCTKGWVPIAW